MIPGKSLFLRMITCQKSCGQSCVVNYNSDDFIQTGTVPQYFIINESRGLEIGHVVLKLVTWSWPWSELVLDFLIFSGPGPVLARS